MVEVPSFLPSSKFPQLCDKTTVGYDHKRGRFVKATEDIPMGTVVCVEQGITVNVDPEKCYRCLGTIENEGMAYCQHCQDFYEPDEIACGQFDDLGIFKLAAHLVFYYPFISIAELLKSPDPEPAREAPTSLSTSQIESVYQLSANPDIGETFKVPKIQQAIRQIVKSLETDENWGRLDFTTRLVTFTKALRIMAERCAKNAHTVYSVEQKECEGEVIPLGTGLFPIASIFNHSCTPNVSAFFVKNTFIFVSHGVKAGEELVDSYGVTYYQHTLQERTNFLANVSGFKCHCNACVDGMNKEDSLSRSFNDVNKCASAASSILDISDYLEYIEPGSKDIEKLIMAFARRSDSRIYNEKMFNLWKTFIKNANVREITFDPYLVRPYIELTLLSWNDEVDCPEEEKSSILFVTHRLLSNFYVGLHPASEYITSLMDAAAKNNIQKSRTVIERLEFAVRSIWKLEERSNCEF